MSADPNQLRLELLRMRAAIEREELAGAVVELRVRTVTLRRVVGAAQRVGAAMGGSGAGSGWLSRGWLSQAAVLFDQRPWLPLLLTGALRLARRRPRATLAAAGALLLALWLRHKAADRAAPAQRAGAGPDAPRRS